MYYFSPQICSKCANNYFYNETSYLTDFQQTMRIFSEYRTRTRLIRIDYRNFPTCQNLANATGNSAILRQDSSSDPCIVSIFKPESCYACPTGQVWSDTSKVCLPNPSTTTIRGSTIANCATSVNNQCTVCTEGYFLHFNNLNCTQHDSRPANCAIMSQRINGACLVCNTTYFLNAAGICAVRTLNDTNCATFSYVSDNCAVCKTNFLYNPTPKLCQAVLSSCQLYDFTQSTLKCLRCATGFNVNNGLCVANTANIQLNNCATFDPASGTVRCVTKIMSLFKTKSTTSYIAALRCELAANVGLKNCILAELVGVNYNCLTCADNAFLFTFTKGCTTLTVPANCDVAEANNACRFCSLGYFLALDTKTCISGPMADCQYYQPG